MPSASTWDSWNDALQDFLIHIHLKGTRAPKTVRFYAVQLRQLAHWAEENSIPLTGFGKRHLDRYLAFRAESVAPGTLRHDAVATKSFCRWCARNEILDRNPLADYQIRAAPQPARFLPSDDEMSRNTSQVRPPSDPIPLRTEPNAGPKAKAATFAFDPKSASLFFGQVSDQLRAYNV